MLKFDQSAPKPPACPGCTFEMVLKKVHAQPTSDHFIFKCERCQLEYPVIGNGREPSV
jgi:predicted  nucleic acid-binding Zn ribbon protein